MTAESVVEEYGDDDIEELEGLEPVRRRPDMYIQDTDITGRYHCVTEIFDNSVDEAMKQDENGNPCCTAITLRINDDASITVIDNGRGIPVGINKKSGIPTVELAMTRLHAGGKFGGKGYEYSGGLHGVGASVVNALSRWVTVQITRGGKIHHIGFHYDESGHTKIPGAVSSPLAVIGDAPTPSATGTETRFLLDDRVFGEYSWEIGRFRERVRRSAFLNPGLVVTLEDDRSEETREIEEPEVYVYPNGLYDYSIALTRERITKAWPEFSWDDLLSQGFGPLLPQPIHMSGEAESGKWEVALQWHNDSAVVVNSYANGILTPQGGTHVDGLNAVLTKAINSYARQPHIGYLGEKESFDSADIRHGLGAIVNVWVRQPQFRGQTKEALNSPSAKSLVSQGVSRSLREWMNHNPADIRVILERARQKMDERIEEEKASRGTAKAPAGIPRSRISLPAKLTDSQRGAGVPKTGHELFIVEGDSACGTAKQARYRVFQGVLPIRGKIINAEIAKDKHIRQEDGTYVTRLSLNEESQAIAGSIGAGTESAFDMSAIRYDKTILLADADKDGLHITSLLQTLFLHLMPEYVEQGHLYVARLPLFRVRVRGKLSYFQTDGEKNAFVAANPSADVQRLKGLGEMMVPDLRMCAFNPDTRDLRRLTIEDLEEASTRVSDLMGSDSSKKWDEVSA